MVNFYGFTLPKLRKHFKEIGENPAKADIAFGGFCKDGKPCDVPENLCERGKALC